MTGSSCKRCESPLESGDLRCAICGNAAPGGTAGATEVVVKILRCAGCAAAITYDAESRTPRCGFCDSTLEVEEIEDPIEQTGEHLPFTVEPDEARAAMREWLGSLGFFRPSDLRTDARLESIRPLFWIAWVFDAEARISWTADSDAGSRRSDWAPHSGQVDMVFDDIVVSASRGLSDDEAYHLAGSFDHDTRRAGAPTPESGSLPAGALVEHFEVQRSQARQRILHAIDRVAAHRVQQDHVPGSNHRNVRTAALLRRLVTRRFALPTYVLAYRYKGSLYRVVVSGQDATCLRGSAPYSVLKILLVTLIGLALVAAVIAALTAR